VYIFKFLAYLKILISSPDSAAFFFPNDDLLSIDDLYRAGWLFL
jgi:hypothetical protein